MEGKNQHNKTPKNLSTPRTPKRARRTISISSSSAISNSSPLQNSKSGLTAIFNAYKNGSSDVRRLLLHECSLIYECNMCRNLFRNITNFLSHKRMFCKTNVSHITSGQGSGAMISPRSSISNVSVSDINYHEVNKNGLPESSINVENEKSPASESPTPNMFLESAMTVIEQNIVPPFSSTLTEGESISGDNEETSMNNMDLTEESNVNSFVCKSCNHQFNSQNSLETHVQSHHSSSTYLYQCPTCTKVFFDQESVAEHLSIEHKKNVNKVHGERNSLSKQIEDLSDACSNVPSLELERLQLTDSENRDNSHMKDMEAVPPDGLINLNHTTEQITLTEITRKNEYPPLNIESEQNHDDGDSEEIRNDLDSIPECQQELLNSEENLLNESNESNKGNNSPSSTNKSLFKNDAAMNSSRKRNINYKLAKKTFPVNTVVDDQLKENNIIKNKINKNDLLSPEVELNVGNSAELSETLHSLNNSNTANENNGAENLLEKNVPKASKKSRKSKLLDSKLEPSSQKLRCRCKICNKQFNALSNLRRHISMFHYRARRFGCTFCDYRAFRRYDIINHLVSVHKMTDEDKATLDVHFVAVHDVPYTNTDMEGDIILVTEANEIVNDGKVLNVCRKRKKQKKDAVVNNETNDTNVSESQKPVEKLNETEKQKGNDEAENLELSSPDTVAEINTEVQAEEDQTKNKSNDLKVHPVAVNHEKEERKKCIRSRKRQNNISLDTDDQLSETDSSITSRNRSKSKRNFVCNSKAVLNSSLNVPVKITRYRLRSDPLLPAKKSLVQDCAKRLYRSVVARGMAAPSTMPDIPTERPQMRPRLTSICYRSDAPSVPVIDSSDLKAASLKAEMIDDTFLHKLVNNSNTMFSMNPLQQSPLKAILQKFDVHRTVSRNKSINNMPLDIDNNSSNSSPRESSEESTTISTKIIDKLSAKVMLNTKTNLANKMNCDDINETPIITLPQNQNDKDIVNVADDNTDNVKDTVDKLVNTRVSNGLHQKMSTSIEEILMLGKRDANTDMITPENKSNVDRDNLPQAIKKQRVSLMKRLSKSSHDDNMHSEAEQ